MNKTQKIFLTSLGSIIIITVITTLAILKSPKEARGLKFDGIKHGHISKLAREIARYWEYNNQKLPSGMDKLDQLLIRGSLSDPETDKPYEYKVLGEKAFQLCANFNYKSDDFEPGQITFYEFAEKTRWKNLHKTPKNHDQGYYCYRYQIRTG